MSAPSNTIGCHGTYFPDNAVPAFIACEQGQLLDATTSDGTLQGFAAQVGCSSSGPNNWAMFLAVACMRAHRVLYEDGPCAAGGAKSALISGTTAGIGIGVGGGLSIAAKADPDLLTKSILVGVSTLFSSIFGIFTASHAAAVAAEEKAICSMAQTINGAEAQIEAALSSGQLIVANAVTLFNNIASQALQGLRPISKPYNAGWGYGLAIQALAIYNAAVLYPQLASGSSGGIGTLALLGGGGYVAHVAGVF